MLFIHGDADDFVPTGMVYPLFEAKPGEKKLWVVPGAAHAMSYHDNPDEYTRRVAAFVGRYIDGVPRFEAPAAADDPAAAHEATAAEDTPVAPATGQAPAAASGR